jgi:two-component sensor histidine kinase
VGHQYLTDAMKKNQLYWVLQFGGWGGLMLTNFLASAMLFPVLPLLLVSLFTLCLAIFSSHLYRLYVKKRQWLDLKIVKLIPKVFLASLLQGGITAILSLAALGFAIVVYIQSDPDALLQMMGIPAGTEVDAETLKAIEEASLAQFTPGLVIGLVASFVSQYCIFYISWSALYFAYQFLQKNREVEIEKWKLQASFKDAELSALKSQINPHFIFNSLNNIRSLVAEDGEKARDSITHLSDLLRFSIQFDQYEKVSLEKEMEVVKDYLELESIQLEERLEYSFSISKETAEISLPPMIVQTLVENAIKHSINELPHGGKVYVESELSNDYLKIFVKNSGQLKNDDPGKRKGIGIKNSKERLRLLYGESASLTVENMNEQMVCATIRIPLG